MTAGPGTPDDRMLTDKAEPNAVKSASPSQEPQAVACADSQKFLRTHAVELRALQSAEQAAGICSAWLSRALDELDSDVLGDAA